METRGIDKLILNVDLLGNSLPVTGTSVMQVSAFRWVAVVWFAGACAAPICQ
jgi:hypothetical protein